MTIYTVHPRPQGEAFAARDDVVLAPESFSWTAFLFGPVWLLAHRLWLWTLAWIVAAVSFGAIASFLSGRVAGAALAACFVLAEALVGFEAAELRRSALARSGRPTVDVVAARGSNEAAARFFRRQIATEVRQSANPEADRPRSAAPQGKTFLTLFPDERAQ